MNSSAPPPHPPLSSDSAEIVYTPVLKSAPRAPKWMSARRMLLLILLSCGGFYPIWYYRQWTQFAHLWPRKPKALLRSLLTLLPLVDILLSYELIGRLKQELERRGLDDTGPSRKWLVLLLLMGSCMYLPHPEIGKSLMLGVSLVYLIAGAMLFTRYQQALNTYWERLEPGIAQKPESWTGGEIAVTCGGVCFWLLLLMGG